MNAEAVIDVHGNVTPFEARVVNEGSKGTGFRVCVPSALAKSLGCEFPGWLRMVAPGAEPAPFFVYARRPPSRSSIDVTLPTWRFPGVKSGDAISITVESAAPWRCKTPSTAGFDWLSFVDTKRYFPVDRGAGLEVWNRHEEPFVMRRSTDVLLTYRLLGLYQAEGSKSAQAHDFSMGGSNPALLRHAVELLGAWGLGPDRLSLEVLHAKDETPEAARTFFAPVGVEITATRLRTGRGGHAATLHVRKSMPLLRMVRAALDAIFAPGFTFPSREAAREYALGWLDGDGTITLNGTVTTVRLAGYKDEQRVTFQALHHGFGWEVKGGKFGGARHHTERSLSADEAVDLALAGAFPFSMSRARLLISIDSRNLAHVRRDRRKRLIEGWRLLKPEIDALAKLQPLQLGVKGVPYPLPYPLP